MNHIDTMICEACRLLARGHLIDEDDPYDGICWNVLMYFRQNGDEDTSVNRLYNRLGDIFEALGMDAHDPLGDYFKEGDRWKGERGERRRALAARMAEYLETTSQGEPA